MWYRYCLLFLLIFLPSFSLAQIGNFQDITSGNQSFSIVISPSLPEPGGEFTATIEDYSGSVFGSSITWTYNGEVVFDAANQRSTTLIAGAAGSNNLLQATLNTPQGATESISRTISPLYVDVIFEPQTRVPDWYIGRALPSYKSQVNATVLLHNGTDFVNSNNLVYSWKVDQTVLEGGPIRGGNKVSFNTPRGGTPLVIVTVSDVQGNTLAKRTLQMTSVSPELEYYEKHSLYGMQNQPLQSGAALVGNVLTLQAEPFNLDTRVYNQPDIALWEINNIETTNGVLNPYEITLSRAGVGGRTILNFHVRSLSEILQGVEDNVVVNF